MHVHIVPSVDLTAFIHGDHPSCPAVLEILPTLSIIRDVSS